MTPSTVITKDNNQLRVDTQFPSGTSLHGNVSQIFYKDEDADG